MKIRLIDPAYEHPFISHSQKVIKRIWFARLTLTTLAALTPPGIDVKITDENVEPIDFEEEVDLVGITGMVMHAKRAYEIARSGFVKGAFPLSWAGPHASSCSVEAKEHVDSVVIGEAEPVWSNLIKISREGRLKPFYKAGNLPFPERDPFSSA